MQKNSIKITKEDIDEIEIIYEKKLAFENLFLLDSITSDNDLYQKLLTDYGHTLKCFSEWWDKMDDKYHWRSEAIEENWKVDFRGEALCKI